MIRKFYRRRRKAHTIWALVVFVVGVGAWFSNYSQKNPQNAQMWLTYALLALVGFLAIVALGLAFFVFRERRLNAQPGFINQPWRFSGSKVRIIGEVRGGGTIRLMTKMQVLLTRAIRFLLRHDDQNFRYPYQVIVVRFPGARRGDPVIVMWDTMQGSLELRKGQWIEVQGIYQHRPSRTRHLRMGFYGVIGNIHEPHGYIRRLDRKPKGTQEYVQVLYRKEEPEDAVNSLERF